jgi:hypothetical protein
VQIKTLALVAAAAFGLAGTNAVLACSTAAWNGGETGNPQEGRPADGVARYSGQCGLKSAATAQFVTDNTPTAETTFRARFYVYTGLSAGTAQVFRANNAGGTQQIGVTYDFAANLLRFATSTGNGSVAVSPNAWYSVELNWSRAAGNMVATVRGAGATTDLTATVTGVGATDAIDTAQLGWVSGTGTATTRGIITDAYESRRSTAIGRLCRGDANLDGTRNSGDGIAIRNEFLNGTLGAGQPDANEDGSVNSGDGIIVRNLFLGGQGACTTGV